MKRFNIWLCALSLAFYADITCARNLQQWSPRLAITAAAGVWSPGGNDRDLFLTSMGGSIGILYWHGWRNQILLQGGYAPLNTRWEYWGQETTSGQSYDVWDVKGSLWSASLELRRLFPTDNKNFLYLGVGLEMHHFGAIEGKGEIYTAEGTITETISEEREPNWALGGHLVPGMFFIFHRKVYIDVAIRFHLLYDGQNNPFWLEPIFALSYRLY